MFKKQLIIIGILSIICACIVGYSAISVSNSTNVFESPGYVHTTSANSETKRIIFDTGTKFRSRAEGTVSFSDIVGEKNNVPGTSFVHYDNSGIASFTDGVIIDLSDLSETTSMKHYAIPSNTIMEYSGTTYSVANSDYGFKDFIWKVSDDKFLVVSPTMSFTAADDDAKTLSNYAEITYIGDGLLQIQTEDNIWQYIANDCQLTTSSGLSLNLSEKNIANNEGKVLLDFNRIVIDSNNNVALSPLAEESKETVIPHFSITAENGADGLSGSSGGSGNSGSNGQPGNPGVDGQEGAWGLDGAEDVAGGDVLQFPVFNVNDWVITGTTCKGNISVLDEGDMLKDNSDEIYGALYLVDLDTGEQIYCSNYPDQPGGSIQFKENGGDSGGNYAFEFTGLKTNHSYMLQAVAPTQIDGESEIYSRQYVSKTFWTDSLGIYMEASTSTTTSVSFNIINQNYNVSNPTENVKIYYKAFKSYAEAAAATLDYTGWMPGQGETALAFSENVSTGEYFSQVLVPSNNTALDNDFVDYLKLQSGDRNKVYVRLGYWFGVNVPTTGAVLNEMSTQILELTPLKERPVIGYPILTQDRNSWGFGINPTSVEDPNNGIVSYTYEFYTLDQFETDSDTLKPNQTPAKTVTKYDPTYTTVPLDGSSLRSGQSYRVRIVAKFNDNEKIYDVVSGFSNSATLEGSVRPSVTFQSFLNDSVYQWGKNVELPFYDAAYGYLHITPGTNSSRLMIGDGHHPQVEVTYNGYYKSTYLLYLQSEKDSGLIPSGTGYLLVNDTDDITAGSVRVLFRDEHFNVYDPAGTTLTTSPAAIGLQPGVSYNISVVGDLTEDGTTVSESNVEIGNCIVTTKPTVPLSSAWTYDRNNETDTLKKATIHLLNPNASDIDKSYLYARQKNNLSNLTIQLFTTEVTITEIEAHSKTAKATKKIGPNDTDAAGNNYFEQIFSNDGLECDLAFFDLTLEDLKTYVNPSKPELGYKYPTKYTIYISDAYDYTVDIRNRDAQQAFKSINNTGKTYDSDHGGYFYINEFDFIEPDKQRIVISATQGLEPIKAREEFKNGTPLYTTDEKGIPGYELQANYDNGTNTAGKGYITYYVFDAVDFFTGGTTSTGGIDSRIKGKDWDDTYGGFQNYEYTPIYDPTNKKTYPQNPYFKYWTTNSDENEVSYEGTDPSYVLQMETPCNAYGLALATITIPIPDSANEMPKAFFSPRTLEEYRNLNGGVNPAVKDSTHGNYMFFGITDVEKGTWVNPGYYTEKKNDDGTNITERGHQYVFAWTICCHKEEETAKYVYPYDSYIPGVPSGKHQFVDIASKVDSSTHTRSYSAGEQLAKIKDEPKIGNGAAVGEKSEYLDDNPNATFGYSGYMLIPHSTFANCPYADVPYYRPNTYSIPWDSTVDTNTVRFLVSENIDEVIYRPTSGAMATDAYLYDQLTGSSAHFTKKLTNVPFINDYTLSETDATRYLLMGNSSPLNSVISEVTINKSEVPAMFSGGYVPEVVYTVPIQRYCNKYTTKNTKLHSTVSNDWIYNSTDNNWSFSTVIAKGNDKFSDDKYLELFVTAFDNDNVISDEDLAKVDTHDKRNNTEDPDFSVNFNWVREGDEYRNATVSVNGLKDIMIKAHAVRFYFTLGSERFFIDKYINVTSAGDLYNVSISGSGSSMKPFIEINDDNTITYNFLINNLRELSKADTGDHSHYDFSNQNDIQIEAKLLFATPVTGYKGLYDPNTLYPTYPVSDVNANAGYALKHYNLTSVSSKIGGHVHPFDCVEYSQDADDTYYSQFDSLNNVGKIGNLYGASATTAPRMGSFMRIRTYNNRIYLGSTRLWQYNTGDYQTNRAVNSQVASGQSIDLPVKLKESPGSMCVYSSQKDESDNYWVSANGSDGGYTYTFNTPETPPSILYDESDTALEQYVRINDAKVKYGISGSDDVMYFTISKEDPSKTTPSEIDTRPTDSVANYYKIASDGEGGFTLVVDPVTYEDINTELKPTQDSYDVYDQPLYNSSCGTTWTELNEYFMPVPKGNDTLSISGLSAETKYYITCWRWTKVGFDPADPTRNKYGFMRIKEEVYGNPLNSFEFTTDTWPEAKINKYKISDKTSSSYLAYEDDLKYVYAQVEMGTFNPISNYYTLELLEKTSSGQEFIAYLACTSNLSELWFNVDNIVGTDEKGNKVYVAKSGDPQDYFDQMTHGLKDLSSPSVGEPLELEYGHEYVLKLHVYDNALTGTSAQPGTGPAYNSSYDFDLDGDSYFIDAAHPSNSPTPVTTEFRVEDLLDTQRATSDSKVVADSVSSISFKMSNTSVKSGSIKENKFVPVAILRHYVKDGDGNPTGAIEYYDVSNRLYTDVEGGGNVNNLHGGLTHQGATLTIDISRPNPDTSSENKYLNLFDSGDYIDLYILGYQGGIAYVTPPAGSATDKTTGKISGTDIPNIPSAVLGPRGLTLNTASYDYTAEFDYSHEIKLDDATYTKLNEYISSADPHSRLMSIKSEMVKDVKVCVGNITVVFQEADTPISKKGLHINLTNTTAPTGLHALAYSVSARSVVTDEYGNTTNLPWPREGEATAKIIPQNLVDSTGHSLITDTKSNLQFAIPYVDQLATNEQIYQWTITIYFTISNYDILDDTYVKNPPIDRSDEIVYAKFAAQDGVSDSLETYTYTFYKEGIVTNRDLTDPGGSGDPSLTGLANKLTNGLFGKGNGAE